MPTTQTPRRARASTSRRRGPDPGRQVVGFFRDCLRHTKGEWAGRPFRLLPWEVDLIERAFGTVHRDGRRKYTKVYLEIPKKNGKSALAAGLALYLLLGENEPGAEIYSAAVDREQAGIVFAQARAMVEANPELLEHCQLTKNTIVRKDTGGFYRVLSADVDTKHGINASGIVIDELHAFPNRNLWDTLQGSTAARRQPLTIEITTAGYDRTSVCWDEHDYAVKVRDGVIDDPTFLPIIYAAEPGDDWTAAPTWRKANPSLGVSVREDFLAQQCKRAQQSPAYENAFKRYHLNLWTEQFSRWLPIEAWMACGAELPDDQLYGVPAYAGLDLGVQHDFSALVIAFALADGRVALRARYWLPRQALIEQPHRPYHVWERQGRLTLTDGTVTDLDRVEADVLAECQRYSVREVAYDQHFATQLAQHCTNAGLTMVDQQQGFALNEPLRKVLALTQEGRFAHGGDPILTWMASNMTVKTGTRGEVRPAKESAGDRIDGIVALAMAVGRMIRHEGAVEESHYADHGLFTV